MALIELEAETIARACGSQAADDVRWLAQRLVGSATETPGVVAHGDFFSGNVVVRNGRLEGVVDWERWTRARLPLHDPVHMRVAEMVPSAGGAYGSAVVEWVTSLRGERDPFLLRFAERVGAACNPRQLLLTAVGCWLAHSAHELRRVADSAADSQWIHANITAPAAALRQLVTRTCPQ
jgi:hypothetical protein